MTTTLGGVRRWARRRSLSLLPVGTTCCAAELDAALGPAYDPDHRGIEVVDIPEAADVLVVAGRLTPALGERILHLHQRMPAPTAVIAFGSCAITGGVWAGTPRIVALPDLVEVTAHIPGCAPPPQHLFDAIEQLRQG